MSSLVERLLDTTPEFETDPYPGKPKILFIGFAESTHTHAWIDLLNNAEFNIRVLGLPNDLPPDHWRVRTYISTRTSKQVNPETRSLLYPTQKPAPPSRLVRWQDRLHRRPNEVITLYEKRANRPFETWLAEIVQNWQPDIIHVLGLDPAGYLAFEARRQFQLPGKWVLQLRGGSDLQLTRLDPELAPKIKAALNSYDQIITDNLQNPIYMQTLGINEAKFSSLIPVPGTGGIDVEALSSRSQGKPSQRRVILLPKAYDSPWSVALPVFEALKMCWQQIQPFEIYMLVMIPNTRMWYWTLPEEIRKHCHIADRIPRDQVLDLMSRARVMLAPSLVDGVPNSMYESMASGTFPIVSPLETIKHVVKDEENVLFARNLYPEEIATALVRAMTDDNLVDSVAVNNLALVKRIADRATIAPRVINYYRQLI